MSILLLNAPQTALRFSPYGQTAGTYKHTLTSITILYYISHTNSFVKWNSRKMKFFSTITLFILRSSLSPPHACLRGYAWLKDGAGVLEAASVSKRLPMWKRTTTHRYGTAAGHTVTAGDTSMHVSPSPCRNLPNAVPRRITLRTLLPPKITISTH
jgi:hypothetical protein